MFRIRAFAALACGAVLTLSQPAHALAGGDLSFAEGSRAMADEGASWHAARLDEGAHEVADEGGHGLAGHDDDRYEHVSAVPEPGTWVLLAAGLPLVGWTASVRRKRHGSQAARRD